MSRLRQVVVASRDLERTEGEVCKLLETFVTFRDEELVYFGLKNAVIPVGHGFLEVVTPLDGESGENSSAERFISKYGEGGYMLIIQVNGVDAMKRVERVIQERALRVVHRGSRNLSDLQSEPYSNDGPGFVADGIAGIHLHPKDVGCITEFVLQKPRNKWTWAGHDWTKHDNRTKIAHSSSLGFAGVTLCVEKPKETAEIWADLLGVNGEHRLEIAVDGSSSRLVLDDDGVIEFRLPKNESENGLVECRVYTSSPKIKDNEFRMVGGLRLVFVHPLGDSHL